MTAAEKLQLASHDHAKSFAMHMTNEVYHARPELSNSGNNRIIDESPAHFQEYLKNPPKQTEAMITGTVVHTAILEPERFLDTTVAMLECDRRTTAGKNYYEKFMIENHDKVVMSQKLYHQVFGMIGSVMAHPAAKKVLAKNHNELSFVGQLNGVAVRCRPDILRQGHLIADLKTTDDAKFSAFQKTLLNYKYHRQAAFYCDLVSQITGDKYDTFTIIAVEKTPPYAVQVFVLDEDTLAKGREEYQRGLAIYAECMSSGKWPAYSDEVVPLSLPSWGF